MSNFTSVQRPNTTQVPNVYLDRYLAELSGNEFKVLMYLTRRIFGFHKSSDCISLSQMLNGIRKKNGDRLDHGTGLSKPTLLRSLKILQEMGLVIAHQRSDEVRGDVATCYQLSLEANEEEESGCCAPEEEQIFTPPGKNLSHGVYQIFTPPGKETLHPPGKNLSHPVVKERYTQKKDQQKKVYKKHHQANASSDQNLIVEQKSIEVDDVFLLDRSQDLEKPGLAFFEETRISAKTEEPKLTDEQEDAVQKLIAAGVTLKQAKRLVESNPVPRILKALENLPHRNAKNPAGYLVRELEDGGWDVPAKFRDDQKKLDQMAKHRERLESEKKAEQERSESTQAALRKVDEVLGHMEPAKLLELKMEALNSISRFGKRKLTLEDDQSPVFKAALYNLVYERYGDSILTMGALVAG